MAIRCNHHGNLYVLITQSGNTTSPFSFNHGTPFEFQSYLLEKRDSVIEGFYNDADIVHS